MIIPRTLEGPIREWVGHRKAILVIGPRQVGKTTLIRTLTEGLHEPVLWLSGDDPAVRSYLQDIPLASLKQYIGAYKYLVIDEAQRLHNAGLTIKLITDYLPDVQVLVTGSSSLDLAAQLKESLTGRKIEFLLLPIAFAEMCRHHGYLTERSMLEHRMLYGYYPAIVQSEPSRQTLLLHELADGLMFKDILALDSLKKPSILIKILQALALQMGSEVSYHEVAQLVGADPATVERYIYLLEQTFVIFRLPSLSRNLRNEIKKGRKIYFFDNGIRNALINNFTPLALRNDTGALWENFLITERLKHNKYSAHFCNTYFWRTTAQQEIDYIEEYRGQLNAYEFKWNPAKSSRFPKSFLNAYPDSVTRTVTPDNFEDFVGYGVTG